MGWKEDQAIKQAEAMEGMRMRNAQRAAQQKISRLTPSSEEAIGGMVGKIMSSILGVVVGVYAGPAAGQAVKSAGDALTEGSIAISYNEKGKPELAEKHAYEAAAVGTDLVGQGISAGAGDVSQDLAMSGDKAGAAAAAGGGAAGAIGADVGSGFLRAEGAKAAPTPGSMEAETAAAYARIYGKQLRREQAMQDTQQNTKARAARNLSAFEDPFAMQGAPPPPSSGGLQTAQLALSAEGSPQTSQSTEAFKGSNTPPTREGPQDTPKTPWYEQVAARTSNLGPGSGLTQAIGSTIGAIGATEKAASSGNEADIPLTWLDLLMANASSDDETSKDAVSTSGGLDPSLMSLFT